MFKTMSDKVQNMKECAVDTGHVRLSDGNCLQVSQPYNSNYGYRTQQQKSKGLSYHSKDKKSHAQNQSYPKSNETFKTCAAHQNGRGPSYGQRSAREQSSGRDKAHQDKNLNPSGRELMPSRRNGGTQDGKKKVAVTSLNHLLNFTIASTERRSSIGPSSLPPVSSGKRRKSRIAHSYNKEQFLQANCQFVVSVSGDYSVHSADPDLLVDWNSIEQVRLFCHQIPSCPICLYPPRAAKMTRCGHVYCCSCILHYLSLGDRKWRKCPICCESIYKRDLKSVTALASHQYSVGDTVTMKLMAREKGTTLVLPQAAWAERKNKLLTLKDAGISQFSKLLSATPVAVLELITTPERVELESQLASIDNDSALEISFIETALEELKARETALRSIKTTQQDTAGLIKRLEDAESVLITNSSPAVQLNKPAPIAYADNYFESNFQDPFFEDVSQEPDNPLPSLDLLKAVSTSSSISVTNSDLSEPKATPLLETPPKASGLVSHTDQSDESVASRHDESESTFTMEDISPLVSVSSSAGSSPGSLTDYISDSPPHDSSRPLANFDLIYFYQASDGQNLYLHPLNAKCLIKENGSLENSPDEISATIVEIDQLSMSEEIRSRYRYLSHLPVTCQFALCELDLKPPTLSRATLALFSGEIDKRRQKRVKKKRDERRRDKQTETRKIQSEPNFSMPTLAHEMTPEIFHDFLSLASSPTSRSHLSCPPQAERSDTGSEGSNMPSPPSFAQALQGKPPPIWPICSPPKLQKATSDPTFVDSKKSPAEGELTEGELVPTYKDAFNVALASASVSVMIAQNASDGKPGNKTAKKGRKKMVLFSTGSTRGTG